MTDFVRDIVEGLRIGTPDSRTPTRVGVMTYADDTDILFHLNVSMNYGIGYHYMLICIYGINTIF